MQPIRREPKPFSSMKLVLFDIDGTLLWSDGAGRSAIREALMTEMGATGPIDGYRFDGKTDPQIVYDLMYAAGHPDADSAAHVQAVCDRYVQVLEGELAGGHSVPRLLPGVDAAAPGSSSLRSGSTWSGFVWVPLDPMRRSGRSCPRLPPRGPRT